MAWFALSGFPVAGSSVAGFQPARVCHRLQSVVQGPDLYNQPALAGLSKKQAMSGHVYHEIFLHLNWHAKGDAPILKGDVESHAHEVVRAKCRELKGVYLHAIGGTDTHVHLAVSIEPFVNVSELVQELKGFSAYQVNREINSKLLQWQRGYGVVSFGQRNLDWVRDYIARQREHHAQDQVVERLELCDECIRAERTRE